MTNGSRSGEEDNRKIHSLEKGRDIRGGEGDQNKKKRKDSRLSFKKRFFWRSSKENQTVTRLLFLGTDRTWPCKLKKMVQVYIKKEKEHQGEGQMKLRQNLSLEGKESCAPRVFSILS